LKAKSWQTLFSSKGVKSYLLQTNSSNRKIMNASLVNQRETMEGRVGVVGLKGLARPPARPDRNSNERAT